MGHNFNKQKAMGEAAGAGGNMALMAMFQPPHFKKTMEKCLSPTIMNKITMQQLSGGAGGMDPTMMMLMMGGGRGGVGRPSMMDLMMSNTGGA
nr:hypothetical protein BaRGS_007256 [Batillaria attramentaria]